MNDYLTESDLDAMIDARLEARKARADQALKPIYSAAEELGIGSVDALSVAEHMQATGLDYKAAVEDLYRPSQTVEPQTNESQFVAEMRRRLGQ